MYYLKSQGVLRSFKNINEMFLEARKEVFAGEIITMFYLNSIGDK